VDEAEIERIVRHLKGQAAPPFEIGPLPSSAETFAEGEAGEDVRDDLFEPSVRLVVTTGQASTSMIQRKFKVGYGRAARLLDAMESRGVVGPLDGSKPRKVLMNRDEMERMFAL
jgi:S-DNA-T family DNA segregation ATPase FtsK/SpoIIIE